MDEKELAKRVRDTRIISRFPYIVYGLIIICYFLRENPLFYRMFSIGIAIGYIPVAMCVFFSMVMAFSAKKDGAKGTLDIFIRTGAFFIIEMIHYAIYGFVLREGV